jgi:DNA-binding response OmpR family regulator
MMTEKSKILICEDESDSQKALKDLLVKRSYEVFTASDGKESIEKAKGLNPDLMLLDIRMPKIDGIEVAREIRKFDSGVKIIFITAFESPELCRESMQYDISDYIVKPTSPEAILESVREALK